MSHFSRSDKQQLNDIGFQLIKKLGSGRHGVVYLALDPQGHKICIKSEVVSTRAHYEQSAINRMYGDSVSTLLSINDSYYFTSPYIEGITLEQAKNNGLSLFEKMKITQSLKEQLNFLHQKGLLHRDLKLDNIIYNPKNAISPAKIIDFGRTVPREEENKYINQYRLDMFFQPWTAPEYLSYSKIDKHSDYYSFGYCLKQFFPEISYSIKALQDKYNYSLRTARFETIQTALEEAFKRQRNLLAEECRKLINNYQKQNQNTVGLQNLELVLNQTHFDDYDSVLKLQKQCSQVFKDFHSTKVHHLLIHIFSFLAFF